jgi:serine/threonine-protein kinase
VFRAYDPEREALVAVKLFKLDLPPERVHQLVAEFERLIDAALIHDAIAAPLATGIMESSAYLAQEYISAESLDLAVREYGPAPAGDALRVTTQLAGALDFAAVVNIHHGGLHPRDVLLSPDATKLTGIGVARALEQVGVTAPVRRPHSASERIAGAAWDRRADIFSLAALVYELLWGRRIAGTGAQAVESLSEIADGDLPTLQSVFARALADDPRARFGTCLEFAEALSKAFPGVAVVAPPAPPPGPRAPHSEAIAREAIEPRVPLEDPEPESPPDLDLRDLDLRAAVAARYADVAVAPAIVMRNLATTEGTGDTEVQPFPEQGFSSASSVSPVVERVPPSVPASLLSGYDAEPPPARTWPLMVMLIFGVVAGLAAGYVSWSRPDPVAPPPQAAAISESPKPASPPGREFTESTIPEPPKTAATPKSEVGSLKSDAGPGRLLVRSTPAGAAVFVDGREHGRTPVVIRDLSRGAHRVRLVRDGYAPAERRVVITPSRPAQSIVVPLAAPRATASRGTRSTIPAPSSPATMGRYSGDLVIESKPPGAKVYLDNKLAGTTPLSLPMVPAGSHAVRLERDGYRRWSASVRVVAAERNRVTASLER